jgi:hypothetical protein
MPPWSLTSSKIGIIIILVLAKVATPTTAAHAQQLYMPRSLDTQTEALLKEYLVSVIMNNLTDVSLTIRDDTGQMFIDMFGNTPNQLGDDIFIDINKTPFTAANGYKFEIGKITAPNGTQNLPR